MKSCDSLKKISSRLISNRQIAWRILLRSYVY